MGSARTAKSGRTIWQFLALDDESLETADVVEMNLAVAIEIPVLAGLDIEKYCRIVDRWTEAFRTWLLSTERSFEAHRDYYKNDIWLFRMGMLASFMGRALGIRYIDAHKNATAVRYRDPSELFLNGVIDSRRGSCGNMAALHVAMCRRLGWPVSLACIKSHFISRFDDGNVVHNIEATHVDETGGFTSDPDDVCMRLQGVTQKAVDCGSDLRKLTAREMIGTFVGLRGRHFVDSSDFDRADVSFALSRALFPQHRRAYVGAMEPLLRRGATLFEPGETGHPTTLFDGFTQMFGTASYRQSTTDLSRGLQCIPMPRAIFTHNSSQPR